MEGTSAPPAEASPLLPPQAPSADAINTPVASVQAPAGVEISASETHCSTVTAWSNGGINVTEPTATTTKSDAPATAQAATDRNGVKAHSNESVVDILHELTTSVGINAELQCTLCHEVLCKPVTSPCGHSFCRVCLIEYLLSKDLTDTQCPICRGQVIHSSVGGDYGADSSAPTFSINVTLWNIIQLLVPAMRVKDPTEEDADYALKYDQFDAKWRIAALQQSGPRPNRRRHRFESDDEIESSDDEIREDGNDGSNSEDGFDTVTQGRRVPYPELRQENTVDGHLEVFRNVVLDRDDANEDGYEGMRVSLAIMEFPSLFQPFNEHQECSIVVLKCEEDEDLDGGIPFFTSDDGEDDEFIITDYYNEIRLRVTDHTGNVVMERTRGATQGIATFPSLRLDVPSGMYDFQFKDDLYGVRLTIRTEVRDLRDEDDNPDLHHEHPMGYIQDQAGERTRSRGRRRHAYDEEEDDEEDSDSGSNDSFIVDDDEELQHGEDGEAQFSGDDESEVDWSNPHELDEEEAMERHERSLQQQRRRHDRTRGDDSSNEQVDDLGESEAEVNEVDVGSGHVDESESDDEGQVSSVSSGRSAKRNRIVDDDSDSDGDASADENRGEAACSDGPSAHGITNSQQTGRKRPRAIMESDDDEGKEEHDYPYRISNADRDEPDGVQSSEVMHGFSSTKRLRHITSRMFQDDDDEFDDDFEAGRDSYGEEKEEDGDNREPHRSRWVGSDPYGMRQGSEDATENDDGDGGDDIGPVRAHDCIGSECDECYEHGDAGAHSEGNEESAHSDSNAEGEEEGWNSGTAIDHSDDADEFSE